ncbi:MAG: hypothetical protein PHS54_01620 [Clostridia bacterium]|nr:hypothetical protein [Clostridia bacterium]
MNINFMLIDFTAFLLRLQEPHVIIGLILAVLGLATVFLARRITRVARKAEDRDKPVENNNKVYITIKAFGLILLLVALIILAL